LCTSFFLHPWMETLTKIAFEQLWFATNDSPTSIFIVFLGWAHLGQLISSWCSSFPMVLPPHAMSNPPVNQAFTILIVTFHSLPLPQSEGE
jgi:hypothetical protein